MKIHWAKFPMVKISPAAKCNAAKIHWAKFPTVKFPAAKFNAVKMPCSETISAAKISVTKRPYDEVFLCQNFWLQNFLR